MLVHFTLRLTFTSQVNCSPCASLSRRCLSTSYSTMSPDLRSLTSGGAWQCSLWWASSSSTNRTMSNALDPFKKNPLTATCSHGRMTDMRAAIPPFLQYRNVIHSRTPSRLRYPLFHVRHARNAAVSSPRHQVNDQR